MILLVDSILDYLIIPFVHLYEAAATYIPALYPGPQPRYTFQPYHVHAPRPVVLRSRYIYTREVSDFIYLFQVSKMEDFLYSISWYYDIQRPSKQVMCQKQLKLSMENFISLRERLAEGDRKIHQLRFLRLFQYSEELNLDNLPRRSSLWDDLPGRSNFRDDLPRRPRREDQ